MSSLRSSREPESATGRSASQDHSIDREPAPAGRDGLPATVAVHLQIQGKWFVDSAGRDRHLTPFSIRLRAGDDVALVFSSRAALPVMKNILTGTDANWLGQYEIVGSRVQNFETLPDHLVSTIPSERSSASKPGTEALSRTTQTAMEMFHYDRDRIAGNRAILLVVDESSPLYRPVEHLWEPLLQFERGRGRLILRLRAEELNTGSGEISCAFEVLSSFRHGNQV